MWGSEGDSSSVKGKNMKSEMLAKLCAFVAVVILVASGVSAPAAKAEQAAIDQAGASGAIAGHSLSKVHRWLHEVALRAIDADTGLYKADGKWNYRDTAADCYPFFTWAAFVTDENVLNGPVRDVLHTEQRLCNTVESIPVPWDFKAGAPQKDLPWDEMVFQASEYVKDCLIAIVEVTGRDEWFDRMREIEDDLWETARIDTPYGKIPSKNIEVNGEQLQALARLYTMTGDVKYLDWGRRLAEYYFADESFVPTRLRDHGCEIIGGLGLLQAVLSTEHPKEAKKYGVQLKRVFDTILAKGCNEDGIMYDHLTKHGRLSDGWGYNYVGYLCYDMAMGTKTYTPHMERTLVNIMKPAYENRPWEGESIDGYADSIEGAIYMLNRLPVKEGLTWVDRETKNNLVDHPSRLENGELWGTMKLQANGVRTTIMHALMHTQGVIARPWQQGSEVGAVPCGKGIAIVLRAKEDYEGVLEFDIPRHRLYMGFKQDWPRMNTLPEWFVVEPEETYVVREVGGDAERVFTGQQLHNGLAVKVAAGKSLTLIVSPK
jgi:hypothetical protein